MPIWTARRSVGVGPLLEDVTVVDVSEVADGLMRDVSGPDACGIVCEAGEGTGVFALGSSGS